MRIRSIIAPAVIGAVALSTMGAALAPAAFASTPTTAAAAVSSQQALPDLPQSPTRGVELWMTNTTQEQFVVQSAQCFRTFMAPRDYNYCQGRSPANPVDVGAVFELPDGTRQLIQSGNPGVGMPWVSIGPSGRVGLKVGQSQNYDFGDYRFVVTRNSDNGNNKSFDIQINPDFTVIYEVWESVAAHEAAAQEIPPDAVASAIALLAAPPAGQYFDLR